MGEGGGCRSQANTARFPFVPGLPSSASKGGRGRELDACTLGAGAELQALTSCDQEALGKAELFEVTS